MSDTDGTEGRELYARFLLAVEREKRESVLSIEERRELPVDTLKGIQTRRLIRLTRLAFLTRREHLKSKA